MVGVWRLFQSVVPFRLKYNNAVLPSLTIAYETWGRLNKERSNAVLLHPAFSMSSHARSNKGNQSKGWWESFVGPGCAVDTNEFYVICSSAIGSCYGSTGPSSVNPSTGKPYGSAFPILSVDDMVKAQFLLLDYLEIERLHASVGGSLGGMCTLAAAALCPDRVKKIISISACCQSDATVIASHYMQRKCIMADPDWLGGNYYGKTFPGMGLKLARELATQTYRCSQEWNKRFGRKRIDPNVPQTLLTTFEIESYLDYQGDKFVKYFDPNSLLYINKAVELFDMSEGFDNIYEGLARVKCPVRVIGVNTDQLFPIRMQRELVDLLMKSGNKAVTLTEVNSLYGHDTFLLDSTGVGEAVKDFLQTTQFDDDSDNRHDIGSAQL